MAFLATFKQRFFRLSGLFLAMLLLITPLAWLSISHPQHTQNIANILSQNAHFFLIFRWLFIFSFFVFWQPIINRIAIHQHWPLEKEKFWQQKRLKIMIWLTLFELVLCENLLLTLFHLLERI